MSPAHCHHHAGGVCQAAPAPRLAPRTRGAVCSHGPTTTAGAGGGQRQHQHPGGVPWVQALVALVPLSPAATLPAWDAPALRGAGAPHRCGQCRTRLPGGNTGLVFIFKAPPAPTFILAPPQPAWEVSAIAAPISQPRRSQDWAKLSSALPARGEAAGEGGMVGAVPAAAQRGIPPARALLGRAGPNRRPRCACRAPRWHATAWHPSLPPAPPWAP